ncbi:hypothetical protein GGS20DRAFT_581907 [Poronia punctata]|nr:hypothetical protein GGS20DRAFT_581907 [Poronia punctata]
MPRKIRIPTDQSRNRESQQRSRARRREYVADLEQRVRAFEERGVSATLEMQRAAREVEWVNRRLVELLGSKGVGEAEVREFLIMMKRKGKEEDEGGGGKEDEKEGGKEEEGKGKGKMSCDEAAGIIAGFKGLYEDLDGVRRGLGCKDEGFCRVGNIRVFELMDGIGVEEVDDGRVKVDG